MTRLALRKGDNYVCPGHCLSQTYVRLTSMCDHLSLETTSHQLSQQLFWPDVLTSVIIHSKYFPDSDWLKAHV